MKSVVITGATGFIGSNLARRLISDGYDVHLLIRPEHKKWRIDEILSQVSVHEVDITDQQGVIEVMKQVHPHWVFHLAAYGAYPDQRDVKQMVKTNIEATISLVEASVQQGCESFVNVGSSSEYGFKDHAPVETEGLNPNSHYAWTKAAATMFCQHMATSHQKNITTLRPYSVYGPYEEPKRFLPKLIIHGMAGEFPPLVAPETARDYIYVNDFIEACILAATVHSAEFGLIFNVGTGTQTTIKGAVDVSRKNFEIQKDPQWGSMDGRTWDTSVWISNSTKIQKTLGWNAVTNFEQGVQKMLAWFKNNPALLEQYKTQIIENSKEQYVSS